MPGNMAFEVSEKNTAPGFKAPERGLTGQTAQAPGNLVFVTQTLGELWLEELLAPGQKSDLGTAQGDSCGTRGRIKVTAPIMAAWHRYGPRRPWKA